MTAERFAYGFACALETSTIKQGVRNEDESPEQREREKIVSSEVLERFADWADSDFLH